MCGVGAHIVNLLSIILQLDRTGDRSVSVLLVLITIAIVNLKTVSKQVHEL